MGENSIVHRLSREAIAAACCGEITLAIQEIIEDLPRLAARLGLSIVWMPDVSPCRCREHKYWLIKEVDGIWRCPINACKTRFIEATEAPSEAARVLAEQDREQRQEIRDARRKRIPVYRRGKIPEDEAWRYKVKAKKGDRVIIRTVTGSESK